MGRPREKTFAVGQKFGDVEVVAVDMSDRDITEQYLIRCRCGSEWWRTRPSMRLNPDALCRSCAGKEAKKDCDGRTNTPEYKAWISMRYRCENPSSHAYANYGGREIKVCKRWQSFDNFLKDMGARPEGMTLERIDNNRGYSPRNCRWATTKEQAFNKRTSRKLTVRGETRLLVEWARRLGTAPSTIWLRLEKYGWSVKDACTIPVRKYKRSK